MANSETLPVIESREVHSSPEDSSPSNLADQALNLLKDGIPKAPESHETVKSFLPPLDFGHQSLEQKQDVIALRPDQRERVRDLAATADVGGGGDRLRAISELNSMATNRNDRVDAQNTFNSASRNWYLRIVNPGSGNEALKMEKR